jgi:hypothetical protein
MCGIIAKPAGGVKYHIAPGLPGVYSPGKPGAI